MNVLLSYRPFLCSLVFSLVHEIVVATINILEFQLSMTIFLLILLFNSMVDLSRVRIRADGTAVTSTTDRTTMHKKTKGLELSSRNLAGQGSELAPDSMVSRKSDSEI
jgi:hypothetical protein